MSSNAGSIGRPVAALAAASALMLGVGLPAQASATANEPARADAAPAAAGYNAQPVSVSPASYIVQSGDTLGLIAARHGVSLNAVFALNGLNMNTVIYPGDRITISGAADASLAATANPTYGSSVPAGNAVTSDGSVSPSLSVASSSYTEIPASSTNAAILASAEAQIGAIQDCTVLGEKALRAAGISGVGDESPESLMRFASPVSNPEPGDFIYYADGGMGFAHNAVYLGGGQAIHSGWNGNQTVVESVNVGSGPVYYRVNA